MQADFIIIGAGIAGASAAYRLAAKGRVILLEREPRPGYHTTGRSAATFIETYGNRVMRGLTSTGRDFFLDPPQGFAEAKLVSPRGCMIVATAALMPKLNQAIAEAKELSPNVRALDTKEAQRFCSVLKPAAAVGAMLDPDAMDIDVDALHQAYLRGMKAGGSLVTEAEVLGLERKSGQWRVATRQGEFTAPVVLNAAGAWADVIAGMAGASPVGLVPKRRTIVAFDPPADADARRWPITGGAGEDWYFLPQGGRVLGSPEDETPSAPCDAQPEELDVALAIDRIETATTMQVRRVQTKWAGLRSFVADKTIVAGFAREAEGFFWLAGQGGYGIQTSPAMGRVAAALATGADLPADIAERGITAAMLAPDRPALQQMAVEGSRVRS
ncbi:MAG: FAD-binding oxidoreductase [Alphaproteobacteria bacterium]|nr:FAD-binding oxidoreductase [Alphaproteobacteria bacterium]